MQVKVMDNFLKSRTKNELECENGIFEGNRFFAVVDGFTFDSSFSIDGKTTGQVAVETFLSALKSLDVFTHSLSFQDISYRINKEFKYANKHYLKGIKDKKIVASASIWDSQQDILYIVGETRALLLERHSKKEERLENYHRIRKILSNKRAHFNLRLIEDSKVTEEDLLERDLGLEQISNEVKKQIDYINNIDHKYAFFAFDGNEIPENKIIVKSTEKYTDVILATDGYPKLFNSLKQTESYLGEVLKSDPLLIKRHRSIKGLQKNNQSYDDRGYLYLKKN